MRNVIDSELKIIYIYRGVKFFTKKEAEKFKKIIDKRESTDQKVETLKIKKESEIDFEKLRKRRAILKASNNGKCWWVYQYLMNLLDREKI